ncbi:MAG: hypothetical protein V7604_2725 [Hyphomicrobiales bacterium]|jgi:hypothetical protein
MIGQPWLAVQTRGGLPNLDLRRLNLVEIDRRNAMSTIAGPLSRASDVIRSDCAAALSGSLAGDCAAMQMLHCLDQPLPDRRRAAASDIHSRLSGAGGLGAMITRIRVPSGSFLIRLPNEPPAPRLSEESINRTLAPAPPSAVTAGGYSSRSKRAFGSVPESASCLRLGAPPRATVKTSGAPRVAVLEFGGAGARKIRPYVRRPVLPTDVLGDGMLRFARAERDVEDRHLVEFQIVMAQHRYGWSVRKLLNTKSLMSAVFGISCTPPS